MNPIFTTYVFLDVVDFSIETIETQAAIIEELNLVVLRALGDHPDIPEEKKILIPTGDGICIAIQAYEKMFGVPISLALNIIKQLHNLSQSIESHPPKFTVRIGINSHYDVEVLDVNGNRGMAGKGINVAHRVMSLADGNQIIVGQTVHGMFGQWGDYPPASFRDFDVLVKHDEPLTVYQYIEKKYEDEGLNTAIPNALKRPDIRKPGKQCGLVNIYPTRNEQFYNDLRDDIENAHSRILISGIGLSIVARLRDLLPLLIEKSQVKIDEENYLQVRLLLLDAMSSPAIFRTFLESNNQEFETFLNAAEGDEPKALERHPYFSHQLFKDCDNAYDLLSPEESLRDAARFYAHNPNCWLAIVDDTIYFQPYTFGGKTDVKQGIVSIGHLLPVFKFCRSDETDVFTILEDHFNKLWSTTDTDLFHEGVRLAGKERLIKKIFRARNTWFQHVYGALYPIRKSTDASNLERKSPRKPCGLRTRQIMVYFITGSQQQRIKYPIVNYSHSGVVLEATGKLHPQLEEVVHLEIVPKGELEETESEPPEAKYLKEKLIAPTEGKFLVTRVDTFQDKQKAKKGENPSRIFIALKACKPETAS